MISKIKKNEQNGESPDNIWRFSLSFEDFSHKKQNRTEQNKLQTSKIQTFDSDSQRLRVCDCNE